MRYWMLLLLLGGLCEKGLAQAAPAPALRLLFRLGRVVLTSGDTLDGPVALQFGPDMLLLGRPDGSVRTFAPASVAACAVQQPLGTAAAGRSDPHEVRLFRSLAWTPDARQKRPEMALFEQLGGGPVLLLRRQYLAQRQVAYIPPPATVGVGVFGVPVGTNGRGLPPPSPPRYLSLTDLHDAFFLARSPDDLAPLPPALKEVLAAFPGQAPQLQAYARAHRLSLNTARDLADLVGYANSLAGIAAP